MTATDNAEHHPGLEDIYPTQNQYLSTAQITRLRSQPDPDSINTVPVGGNRSADYLKRDYIIRNLHNIFGIENVSIKSDELMSLFSEFAPVTVKPYNQPKKTVKGYKAIYSCRVEITITIPGTTPDQPPKTIIISQYGTDSQDRAEDDNGVIAIQEAIETASKGANTNALKRAATLLGSRFGLDLQRDPSKSSKEKSQSKSTRSGGSLLNPSGPKTPAQDSKQESKQQPETKAAAKTPEAKAPEPRSDQPEEKQAAGKKTDAQPSMSDRFVAISKDLEKGKKIEEVIISIEVLSEDIKKATPETQGKANQWMARLIEKTKSTIENNPEDNADALTARLDKILSA